ncbi:hypothetical protein EKO27_g6562 [Xylaria grammica]|uniref:DUF8212 domain-containing protein n=1 Tax=Xylaria grammica TaxID=363999 RepID=A0A439D2D0_9PEZI|nr:hypothetical protein EKO27_g6562 [Xylaria grammica]
MWLLNSCTWEMKEFISHKQAPPYAILSHTWGDEEVSFREWQHEPLKFVGKKGGFKKINYCCQQAAADGLEWVWVDTSAELSEAINSMFQWYKNAALCYAYLFDVEDNIESKLAGSYWVTRGWTLQELIAPREVVFYSSSWQELGKRSKLSAHLAAVTRINEPFLTGQSLDEASIAQRMSWAANRKTSREEDVAYCLLGIFNVNMPMIYGEGPKAFRRLQELLVREYPEDHSLFAWGKIVEELTDGIYDTGRTWGLEPINIQSEPDRVCDELLGLLAESPKDFEHSGQIVRSPEAAVYFLFGSKMPSVSNLVGRAAHVELPKFNSGPNVAFHVKRPPIVRLWWTTRIVILCGRWDDSHTKFYYITIPITEDTGQSSRMYELIMSDTYTHVDFPGHALAKNMQKFMVSPLPLRPPQATDLVIRRNYVSYPLEQRYTTSGDVDFSPIKGRIRSVNSRRGRIATWSIFNEEGGYGFSISFIRLGYLDHSHEDPAQGRDCGRFRFGLHAFRISQESDPENTTFSIVNKQGNRRTTAATEELNPRVFRTFQDATDSDYLTGEDATYTHDALVSEDKWRFTIVGVADVYISLERIFLDGYDSDDDLDDNESHRFVDVLDFVVQEPRRDEVVKKNNDQEDERERHGAKREDSENSVGSTLRRRMRAMGLVRSQP